MAVPESQRRRHAAVLRLRRQWVVAAKRLSLRDASDCSSGGGPGVPSVVQHASWFTSRFLCRRPAETDMPSITPIEVTSPGVEAEAVTPLRVDSGDTVAIGDVTITESDDSTLAVSSAVMNASAVTVAGVEYPANTCVQYTLTITGTVRNSVMKHVDFVYTTTAGDERTVRQQFKLLPHFESAGGVLAYGSGTVTTLSSAPVAALYPGIYDVDTAAGAFTVSLRQVRGVWRFLDPSNATAANNFTIGTTSQTFNSSTGPLIFDGSHLELLVYNVDGTVNYKWTV